MIANLPGATLLQPAISVSGALPLYGFAVVEL